MIKPGTINFYITNVCNFNCENCLYLNNYPVKGHQKWIDNKEKCQDWAKKIDPAIIMVLGGEPMLNPDFMHWINGLAEIWPTAEIRVNTNGSCLDRWPDLYDVLSSSGGRINLSISGHNEHNRLQEIRAIKNFLKGNITEFRPSQKDFRLWVWKKVYNQIKDSSWPDVVSLDEYNQLPQRIKDEIENQHQMNINDYVTYVEPGQQSKIYKDENGVRISWAKWDEFMSAAVKFDHASQSMTLYDSDPNLAISICHGGHCAYIKNGLWYKCSVMGILPDMLAQDFPFDISQQDRNLILSYEPASPDWSIDKLAEFYDSLYQRKTIPQCKFCPEPKDAKTQKIHATTKKIKVTRKKLNTST